MPIVPISIYESIRRKSLIWVTLWIVNNDFELLL